MNQFNTFSLRQSLNNPENARDQPFLQIGITLEGSAQQLAEELEDLLKLLGVILELKECTVERRASSWTRERSMAPYPTPNRCGNTNPAVPRIKPPKTALR